MKIINTERVIMRDFSITDAQGMMNYLSNPRVNCFLSEKLSTIEEACTEAERRSQDDTLIAVCLKDSNCLIGELMCIKEGKDTYFIGWQFNENYEGNLGSF